MKRPIVIPFTGFDCGQWEFALDHAFDCEASILEKQDEADRTLAPSQNLDSMEYEVLLINAYDPNCALPAIARAYVAEFSARASDKLKIPLKLKFAHFKKTKDAQTGRDQIVANISLESAKLLLRRSAAQRHRQLRMEIEETWTSAHLEDWLAKPIETWNRDELGTLLAAIADPELEERVCLNVIEYGTVLDCIYNGFDNKAFEISVRRLRKEKARKEKSALRPTSNRVDYPLNYSSTRSKSPGSFRDGR
jgi:hypothetical protein